MCHYYFPSLRFRILILLYMYFIDTNNMAACRVWNIRYKQKYSPKYLMYCILNTWTNTENKDIKYIITKLIRFNAWFIYYNYSWQQADDTWDRNIYYFHFWPITVCTTRSKGGRGAQQICIYDVAQVFMPDVLPDTTLPHSLRLTLSSRRHWLFLH